MAKRAPILGADYNPVGARLQQALRTIPDPESSAAIRSEFQVKLPSSESPSRPDTIPAPAPFAKPKYEAGIPPTLPPGRGGLEAISDAPRAKEMMASTLRCRCTEAERKKWHDFAKDVTGEHNQFSHVFRAMLLLLENSHEYLMKLLPEMKSQKVPAKQDAIGIALYEQKLSQILWDAVKGAGRPRG